MCLSSDWVETYRYHVDRICHSPGLLETTSGLGLLALSGWEMSPMHVLLGQDTLS